MYNANMVRTISSIIYILLILVLFVDSVGSTTTVQKFVGLSSHSIALLLFLVLLNFRIQFRTRMWDIIIKINAFVVFPVLFLTSVTLAIIDAVTYPNFVFSQTSLQYTQIYSIAIFSGAVALLQMPTAWLINHYKRIIFYGAPVALLLAIIANIFPFDQFLHWSQEDEIIEQFQNAVLFLSLILCFRLSMFFRKKKDRTSNIFFVFIFIGLFVLFAEEVSWGQRIIGIETPEVFMEKNIQHEVSIHNLYLFDRHIDIAYLLVSFLGSIGWAAKKRSKFIRRHVVSYIIPMKFCTSYFIIPLLFYTFNAIDLRFGHFDEFMELLIYAGLMFTFITTYVLVTKRKGIYEQLKDAS